MLTCAWSNELSCGRGPHWCHKCSVSMGTIITGFTCADKLIFWSFCTTCSGASSTWVDLSGCCSTVWKKNRMKHQHGKKWVPIWQCAENICKNKLPVCFPLFFGLKGFMTIGWGGPSTGDTTTCPFAQIAVATTDTSERNKHLNMDTN